MSTLKLLKEIMLCFLIITIIACNNKPSYNTIIRNGTIYDGNGSEPYKADIAINADTIAFIGDLKNASAICNWCK